MSTQQSTSAPTSPGSFPLHPATLSDVNSTSLHSMTEEATSTTSPPSDLVIVDKIHHVDIHVSKNNELMHMMKLLTELFYPSLSFSSTTTTSTSPFSLDPLSTTSSLNAEWPLPESSDHFVHHQVPLIHQLTSQFLKTFPNAFLDVWHYLKPFIEFLHEHVHGHLTLKLPPPRASMHPTPPLPPLRPSAPYHHFGETWVDPYGGYEDRADPEVMKYMEQEQKYTETCLAPIQPLTQQVYQELMARMHASDASYTFEYHGFSYSSRKIKGKEYLLHGRQPIHPDGSLGVWEVYLDENKLATELEQNKETHEEIEAKEEKETKEDNKTDSMVHYFHLMFLKHHTNTWVAYGVDRVGHDQGTIYICQFPNSKSPLSTPSVTEGEEPFFDASLSVTTPLIVHETLHDAGDCFEFDPSGKFGFYVTMDTSYRSCRVYCHELDTPQSQDVLVYDEKDPAVCVTLKRAPNLSCLWILAITQTSSEVYALSFPYAPLTTTPRVLYPRQLNVMYTVQMHDDQTLYVCTNEQGKWNNWIFRAPWHSLHARQVVLEHRDFVMIEAFQLHQSYLAVFERSNGLQHIRVMHAQALEQYHYISFPESVYAIWPLTPTEDIYGIVSETHYATSELLLCYTSLITPKQWILYNMQSKMLRTVYQDTILGPLYVPHQYTSERLFAISDDGTAVPISMVYRQDLRIKGQPSPLLLLGYGAYGCSYDPIFSAERLSLLDRGMIVAIAHVRGGSELCHAWYQGGKHLKKKTSFLDFKQCIRYLIHEAYTAPHLLAIQGRSAGATMMGVMLTMDEVQCQTVVLEFPYVDVLNTLLNDKLPWTVYDYEEFGNPVEDVQDFHLIRSYCPYTQLKPRPRFPHVYIVAAKHDPKVQFHEPLKFVAKLRECKRTPRKREAKEKNEEDDDTLVVLLTRIGGHAGLSGQYAQCYAMAQRYAFLIYTLGVFMKPLPYPDSTTSAPLNLPRQLSILNLHPSFSLTVGPTNTEVQRIRRASLPWAVQGKLDEVQDTSGEVGYPTMKVGKSGNMAWNFQYV